VPPSRPRVSLDRLPRVRLAWLLIFQVRTHRAPVPSPRALALAATALTSRMVEAMQGGRYCLLVPGRVKSVEQSSNRKVRTAVTS
jgi:hypothetical protein